MLLTVKGLGSLKVADVATVAEVYSPGPHAMMDMKELPARRQTFSTDGFHTLYPVILFEFYRPNNYFAMQYTKFYQKKV